MAKTTLTLNRDYFNSEVTNAFLKDFENACLTMELTNFTRLFINYNLEFIKDYKEVFDLIADITTRWKNSGEESKLLDVVKSDSKCIFCFIGKSVKVYKWTYKHTNAKPPMNRIIYQNQVGFYFEFDNDQLIEFGVCNAFK